jgi:hypothetical protein
MTGHAVGGPALWRRDASEGGRVRPICGSQIAFVPPMPYRRHDHLCLTIQVVQRPCPTTSVKSTEGSCANRLDDTSRPTCALTHLRFSNASFGPVTSPVAHFPTGPEASHSAEEGSSSTWHFAGRSLAGTSSHTWFGSRTWSPATRPIGTRACELWSRKRLIGDLLLPEGGRQGTGLVSMHPVQTHPTTTWYRNCSSGSCEIRRPGAALFDRCSSLRCPPGRCITQNQ